MKKLIAAMTAFAMLLCGCSSNVSEADASSTTITAIEAKMNQSDEDENSIYLDKIVLPNWKMNCSWIM